MTRPEILQTITATLADLLEQDDLALSESASARTVDGWDSINNVRLLISLEQEFGFEFATDEIERLKNVGALIDLIESKRG